MHEVSRVFLGSNLTSDAPCGSSSTSAPTLTTAPAPTLTLSLPDPHQAATHLQMVVVARPQNLAHPQSQG
jgi:hypothetical protein